MVGHAGQAWSGSLHDLQISLFAMSGNQGYLLITRCSYEFVFVATSRPELCAACLTL